MAEDEQEVLDHVDRRGLQLRTVLLLKSVVVLGADLKLNCVCKRVKVGSSYINMSLIKYP